MWSVVDGTRVTRTVRDETSGALLPGALDATSLTAAGVITALHLSPDGIRVAAVAGGRVVVGAVVRDAAGGARVGSVQVLRPESLSGVLDVGWTRTDQIVAVGARSEQPIAFVSVDGLDLDAGPTTNLTPPVTTVAAAPGRPLVVVDQSGVWTLPSGGSTGSDVWRSVPGASASAVPAYPG